MTTRTKRLLWLMSQKPKLRTFSGVPPLTFKAKKSGTLKNYRIYGNTVNGESVGDRTENLFDISKATRDVGYTYNGDGDYVTSASNTITGFIAVDENTTYTIKNTGYPPYRVHYFDINKQWISRTNPLYDMETSPGMAVEFTTPNNSKYIIMQEPDTNLMNLSTIMLNTGSEPLPYEPYGYRVPVTVTNGTDTETTNIYLPEQIKMVGNEAEYVDYKEQKQHRVRKNLLQNTATNQTINGVTFTVNEDGSVTCNGTASSTAFFAIAEPVNLSKNIISGCPRNGNSNSYLLRYQQSGGIYVEDKGNGVLIPDYGDSRVIIRINAGYTCNNLTFFPMIRLATIEDDTYEPYIADTELDVTLPALPTIKGTNVLSVGTAVQPSNIEITGKIKGVTA